MRRRKARIIGNLFQSRDAPVADNFCILGVAAAIMRGSPLSSLAEAALLCGARQEGEELMKLGGLSMSADATIRRLRPDDADSFRAIRLEALKANPDAFGSTFEFEDKLDLAWFAGRLENSHVMGAFRGRELVGTAGFAVQQGQKNAHKGRLWGMYVRSSSRSLGVGHLLVRAVLDVARENVELIQLSVVRENRPARRLYESVGFLEFGMEPKASKLGDKYYDEVHMALDFGLWADLS
jgi:ribosomal protein S18 acetylase RimI-like enzyme